jgi:hypothetical protein
MADGHIASFDSRCPIATIGPASLTSCPATLTIRIAARYAGGIAACADARINRTAAASDRCSSVNTCAAGLAADTNARALILLNRCSGIHVDTTGADAQIDSRRRRNHERHPETGSDVLAHVATPKFPSGSYRQAVAIRHSSTPPF